MGRSRSSGARLRQTQPRLATLRIAVPAPIAPLLGFALGAILALASGAPAERARPRALALVTLFAALVWAPACAAPFFVAEEWALGYLLEGADVPSAVELVLVGLDALAVVAAYAVASDPVRGASGRTGALLVGVPLALAAVVAAALGRALAVDGTTYEVRGGFAVEPVVGGRLGWILALVLVLVVGGAAYTAARLRAPSGPGEAKPPGGRARGLGVRA
jgi:hypothetical protein